MPLDLCSLKLGIAGLVALLAIYVGLTYAFDQFSIPKIRQFNNIQRLEKVLDSYKTTRVPSTETPSEEARDPYESISSVFPKFRRSVLKMHKESYAANAKSIVAAIAIIPCRKSPPDCKQSDFSVISESDDVFIVRAILESNKGWNDLCAQASLDRPVMTVQFTREIDNKSLRPIIYYMFICANYMDELNIINEARNLELCHEDRAIAMNSYRIPKEKLKKVGLFVILISMVLGGALWEIIRRLLLVRSAGEVGIRLQPLDEEPANDLEPEND